MQMNEYDIEDAQRRLTYTETPNLRLLALTLGSLVDWASRNSDGWPYWQAPRKASARVQALVADAVRVPRPVDVTDAEMRKALTPLKAFLTRQGVSHDAVIFVR